MKNRQKTKTGMTQQDEQSRLSKLRASYKRLEEELLSSGFILMSPDEMRQLHTNKVYGRLIPKKKGEQS